MTIENPSDAAHRLQPLVHGADLSWVAEILAAHRAEILERWLDAAAAQPFHRTRRREQAVADHIPLLFDAVVSLLQSSGPRWIDPAPPLDDPAILEAARMHARSRFEQGLAAADVVTEFRLLRQEIGRALHLHLGDAAPAADVTAAELLVHDALDGAIALGLTALTEQIEETRDEFLAATVHDVLQPATSLRASLQLAQRYATATPPDVARLTDAHSRALAAADHMLALLTQLADVARVALGQVELHLAPVALADIFAAAVRRLDPEAARRCHIDVSGQAGIAGLWDGAALERVAGNLLSNAMKFAPDGTPIEITIWEQDGEARATVRDYGIGMTAEELSRVFDRYTRAGTAVRQAIEGQGLGLYVCRGIVQAHGGRLWAESAGPGMGTTIHLALPYQRAQDSK